MYTVEELAIITLDSLSGLEYKHKNSILNAIEDLSKLFSLDENVFQKIALIIGEAKSNAVKLAFDREYVKKLLNDMQDRNIVAITFLSDGYPERLKQIAAFPLVIYAKGRVELLKNENPFAIVGSRKTLPYATKFASYIAKEVSDLGGVVVTGSAIGGDRSAILGALDSGNVISVLAHGHDCVYPESNRSLIEKVEKKGLVISEYPFSVASRSWMFPVRNRIIAGLSRGVLVVSGEMDSGARHTANYALEFNREIFALPYSIGITSGSLCNHLIKSGAYLCEGIEDVCQCLDVEDREKEESISLDEEEKKVYYAIKNGCDNANSLIAECGLKIFELTPIISSLEIKGLIVKMLGNKYKSIK